MIKKFIINKSMKIIKTNYSEYNEEQLEKIQYGLEAIYLSTTKLVAIILLSILLNTFVETIIVLLFFNIIRTTGFGLHASKSWICWITSVPAFGLGPILCKYIRLPMYVLFILAFLSLLCFVLFAPADTHKRPLIRKKRRIIYKVLTILIAIGYFVTLIFIKNQFLQNAIVYSMLLESILICPLTYKIFKLPYNNYKKYSK